MKPGLHLLLFVLFSFFVTQLTAQKEFEGVIKYKHTVTPKEKSYDVNYDYSALGQKSEYYYKKGNYKFVNHGGLFAGDLFRASEVANYLPMSKSDTAYRVDGTVTDMDVMDVEVKDYEEKILGHSCVVVTLKLIPSGQDGPISYRRYYCSKDFPVDPDHFKNCKGNAYNVIYEKSQSLPLKIEFEWPDRTITWEAYAATPQKVNSKLFEIGKKWVIVPIN
ncbi:hypothetical protein [Fluviicola sp.]|uniref:hypothetical protein n=1 Tax=Fluviicola sp. TaxID=1917219 RepID=UPI0031D1EA96